MSDQEFVRLVMQEVGPREEGILAVSQTSDDAWSMHFENVAIEIELEPESRRLVLSTEIGAPSAANREAFYETVLLYNLLWRETGGVRIALTEPGGAIVQMVDLHCSSLSTDLLARLAHNLNERTLLWRALLMEQPDEERGAVAPSDAPLIHV